MSKKQVEVDSIIFDSKLESNMYILLRDNNIESEIHKTYELVSGFKYQDIDNKKRSYSNIEYSPDFVIELPEYILVIEVKGYARKDYKLRKKLFIQKYRDTHRFVEVNTISDMNELIQKIKKISGMNKN